MLRKCTSLLRYKRSEFYARFYLRINSQAEKSSFYSSGRPKDTSDNNNMGSSISRGRKYNPTKNASDQNPNDLGHEKFTCTDSPEQSEYIEDIVCKVTEIDDDEMKVFELGQEGGKVLLIKQQGTISALGAKCTHYGASLENGILGNGRVRCPWHGACFNILTGDIEDFPGLDSLPCFDVTIKDGKVRVRADRRSLQTNKRIKPFSPPIKPYTATIIVVGGGPAGSTCVETLRQEGYSGRIVLVTAEKHLPYDRVKLSKAVDVNVDNLLLRNPHFYKERHIEILFNTHLISLDYNKKFAQLGHNHNLQYDKIFLATGGSPKVLHCPGSDLKNIFLLRTADDAKDIKEALHKSSNIVILGTSFIGMEFACACQTYVRSVTIIGKYPPFKTQFGSIVGNSFRKLYEDQGIIFHLYKTIENFEGKKGFVSSVTLSDGTKLSADIVLVAIGTTLNTDYMEASGMQVLRNGSIEVNEYLETKYRDVYAGGEIALAPVLGHKTCISHWGISSYHGYMAAKNMLGKKKPIKSIPFFWTVLFGKSLRFAGYPYNHEDIVIEGQVEELDFIAFYCTQDQVVAIASVNRDPVVAYFAEQLYEGKKLLKTQIKQWVKSLEF